MTKQILFFILFTFVFSFLNAQAIEPKYYGGEFGKKLDWTLFYLDNHYVDSTDNEYLAEVAIRSILKELDPYSYYQSKKELEDQQKNDEGRELLGFGFSYYIVRDTPVVTFIDEFGPAKEAGLQLGDQLLKIDNFNLVKQHWDTLSNKLTDREDPSTIRLDIKSEEGQLKTVPITSRLIPVPVVVAGYMIDEQTGLIKIDFFNFKTGAEFKEKFEKLKSQGMKNLVLDLRDNRGGVVKSATELADQFLPESKLIMYQKGKGFPREDFMATNAGLFETGNLAILTSSYTASASEIFTGALQDWDRAVVVGQPTYGKGLIQQSYLLEDGSAVRLTIGRYFTPNNRILQKKYDYQVENDPVAQLLTKQKAIVTTKELPLPDSLFSKTKSGRKIIKGFGGIIPDIYIPLKTERDTFLEQLNEYNIIYRFVCYYTKEQRKNIVSQCKSPLDFRKNTALDEQITKAFIEYVPTFTSDVIKENLIKNGVSKLVLNQIKSWMATQIYGLDAFYAQSFNNDPAVLRALKAFSDGW